MTGLIDAVLAAEDARARALVARDAPALERLLHERLVYIHATGAKHDRAQLLQFLREGPQFVSVHLQAPQVQRLAEGVALVTGLLRMRLRREAGVAPVEVASLASQVWLRVDDAWRLVLFQSTKA